MTSKGDKILKYHFFFFLCVGLSYICFTSAGNGQKVLNSQEMLSGRCFTTELLKRPEYKRQGHRF